MSMLVRLIALACLAAVALATCPDLPALRTSYVKSSFDPTKVYGMWFEVAFIDIGQTGAACQMFNITASTQPVGLSEAFSATYAGIPLSLPFSYNATADLAVYNKWVHGAEAVLELPNVFLDVLLSDDGSTYAATTSFVCKTVLGLDVTELRIAYRKPVIPDTVLAGLVARAKAQGLVFGDLGKVDFSKCKIPGM